MSVLQASLTTSLTTQISMKVPSTPAQIRRSTLRSTPVKHRHYIIQYKVNILRRRRNILRLSRHRKAIRMNPRIFRLTIQARSILNILPILSRNLRPIAIFKASMRTVVRYQRAASSQNMLATIGTLHTPTPRETVLTGTRFTLTLLILISIRVINSRLCITNIPYRNPFYKELKLTIFPEAQNILGSKGVSMRKEGRILPITMGKLILEIEFLILRHTLQNTYVATIEPRYFRYLMAFHASSYRRISRSCLCLYIFSLHPESGILLGVD